MWDYTDKVMDHFLNPRNVGFLEDADGVGEVGSMACGDALRLSFRLGEDGRIAEVRFQTFGCGSAIASSSVLTEMLVGKTLEEAARITNEDIVRELGGLPRQKMHCSVMGREALEAAIVDYYRRRGQEVPCALLHDDPEVCHCFQVSEHTIREAIARHDLADVEDVTHYTKAGGGCGQCHDEIRRLLAEHRREKEAHPPVTVDLAAATTTGETAADRDAAFRERVAELLAEDVAPALRADGGDVELVAVHGRRVHVRLTGACAACPASGATVEGWIQQRLRELLDEEVVVVEEKA